jgi:predicted nuclease of predicted toxin-antitoxin system
MTSLLADENIDRAIVDRLREKAFDVWWVAESAPATPDPDVLTLGHELGRLLITFDVGIGPQAFRRRNNPPSIVILRLRSRNRSELLARFELAWPLALDAVRPGLLVTAYPTRTRSHRLPVS